MAAPKVFISYAHKDRAWCELVQEHLGGLRHHGRLDVWVDDQILAGDEWRPEILRQLDEATIILLIVTPAFLNSKFSQTVELIRAMERHRDGSARVIPIIAERCDWQSLPITELQARPQDAKRNLKPLRTWRDKNEPLAAIATEIRHLIQPVDPYRNDKPSIFAQPRTYLLHRRHHLFVGRTAEREKLNARLAVGGSAAICAVNGMGGVGKTELALQVAGDSGGAFPDGIVTVNLLGAPDSAGAVSPPLTPEAARRAVLAELDPMAKLPDDPAALAGTYRRTLAGKRLLLILDNALDTAQVSPLVPPEPVALLVTSRNRIDLSQSLVIDLDILEPDDAMALMREEIGEDRALDDTMLAEFAKLCGYLPVALLAIVGTIRKSRSRTPVQLLARLKADRAAGLTDVLARLRPSIEALAEDDPALARRFARLAVFPADFGIDAVAHVWECDEDMARDGLDALFDRSLLLDAVGGDADAPRCRLHDLMRDLAAERLGEDAHAAHLRHATFFKDLLDRCGYLYHVGNTAMLEKLALFDRERANIEAGQRWAAERHDADDDAARLAAGFSSAGIDVIILRLHRHTQIAWLEAALAACRRLGNRQDEGVHLSNLGLAWSGPGETRKAIEHYEQALAIAREFGNRRDEGMILGNIGVAYYDLGETRKAIEHYEQALAIARECGNQSSEGGALCNLGNAWARLGETHKAIDHYERALEVLSKTGHRLFEGNTLWAMAEAYEKLGETVMAIEKAKAAFGIRRDIKAPDVAECTALLLKHGVDPDGL